MNAVYKLRRWNAVMHAEGGTLLRVISEIHSVKISNEVTNLIVLSVYQDMYNWVAMTACGGHFVEAFG